MLHHADVHVLAIVRGGEGEGGEKEILHGQNRGFVLAAKREGASAAFTKACFNSRRIHPVLFPCLYFLMIF